jgi:hypothetical protein
MQWVVQIHLRLSGRVRDTWTVPDYYAHGFNGSDYGYSDELCDADDYEDFDSDCEGHIYGTGEFYMVLR